MTLYEAENASGLANGQPFPLLGSPDNPAQNADGSTDIYFGPKAPKGKEGNCRPLCPARAISRSCGSAARPRLPSTRAGSRAISRG